MKKYLGLAMASFLLVPQANAQEWATEKQWTYAWLGQVCASIDLEDILVCGSYLQGFFGGQRTEVEHQGLHSSSKEQSFCRPIDLTIEQISRLVADDARERPGSSILDAHRAVSELFRREWPCEKAE